MGTGTGMGTLPCTLAGSGSGSGSGSGFAYGLAYGLPCLAARLFVALLLFASGFAHAEDAPFGSDKALHFSACTGVAAAGYAGSWLIGEPVEGRLGTAVGLALFVGVAKELYDTRGFGTPSMLDLAWDLAGAATGAALAWLTDWLVTRLRESPAR